jgi:hypothetical protein
VELLAQARRVHATPARSAFDSQHNRSATPTARPVPGRLPDCLVEDSTPRGLAVDPEPGPGTGRGWRSGRATAVTGRRRPTPPTCWHNCPVLRIWPVQDMQVNLFPGEKVTFDVDRCELHNQAAADGAVRLHPVRRPGTGKGRLGCTGGRLGHRDRPLRGCDRHVPPHRRPHAEIMINSTLLPRGARIGRRVWAPFGQRQW